VDQAGRSLYLLTKDSANTTTCTATCVASWPAFEVAGSGTVAAGDGVTGALATLTRSDDGNRQVTYNGVPLYYFGGDSKAGDTNGQGLGGVWFLAGSASTAQGGRISGGVGEGTASGGAATGAPPASPASGGY
jgi:predicted lipoprotein with Yx(FWY)xxD motif